jgi:hypothetical protein
MLARLGPRGTQRAHFNSRNPRPERGADCWNVGRRIDLMLNAAVTAPSLYRTRSNRQSPLIAAWTGMANLARTWS